MPALGLAGFGAGTLIASRKATGQEVSGEEAVLQAGLQAIPYAGGKLLSRFGSTAKEMAPNILFCCCS